MANEEGGAWSVVERLVRESGHWVCSANGVRPWVEFKDAYAEWLKSNPPTEQAKEDIEEGLEIASNLKVFFWCAAQNFLQSEEITYRFRTDTIGRPDLFVKDAGNRPLIVGIVDFHHAVEDVVRRLFTYMLITGASFGVLMDGGSFRYAKISKGDTLLSAPVSSWWALSFVLQLARDEPQQSIGDYSLSLAKLTPRTSHVVESFKSIAKQRRSYHSGAIIHGMENLSFGDLEDVSCKWSRDTDSSVISAKYKHQPVVLKVRDLTTPWFLDVETNLRKVITEVDTYKTLHKLQGVWVPRLFSWGFLCGTMFAYVMTSDEGCPISSYFTFSVRSMQAALAPAHEALAKIHARGLIHGDLSPLKILLRRGSNSSSQSSWVKIIGFSSASYVGPKEIQVAAAMEMAKLQQCFQEVLVLVRAEEAMEVDRFLLALQKSSSIVHKFPKIRDLLNALGANLQGDDESSPKTDEASDLLSPYFKEYVMVDVLSTPRSSLKRSLASMGS